MNQGVLNRVHALNVSIQSWCSAHLSAMPEHVLSNKILSFRLENVMKTYMVDFAQRMAEIKSKLDTSSQASTADEDLAESEKLLEELMDIVENIDFARDLHTIGGLPTLVDMMKVGHQPRRALLRGSECYLAYSFMRPKNSFILPYETRS